MNLRHQFIAHRGETNHETSVAYLRLKLETLERHVRIKMRKTNRPNKNTIRKYIRIVTFLIDLVENKFKNTGVKTWNHFMKENTPDQANNFMIAGPKKISNNKKL